MCVLFFKFSQLANIIKALDCAPSSVPFLFKYKSWRVPKGIIFANLSVSGNGVPKLYISMEDLAAMVPNVQSGHLVLTIFFNHNR
jgi:hypothetical protein